MDDNWMEVFLDAKGFWVSGTSALARRWGMSNPDTERLSLRFVASGPEDPRALFFLVWESIAPHKAPQGVDGLTSHPLYTHLSSVLQPLYLLVTLTDGRFFLERYRTSDQLAQWFYQRKPALSSNVGTAKETNRPQSQRAGDLFRTFTRRYLSRFCISNDIDALRLGESEAHPPLILELKKPTESIHEWKPYIDDCANYMYLKTLAQKRGLDFRVIAYNRNSRERVGLFWNVECDRPNRRATGVRYRWALVSPEQALGPIPPSTQTGVSHRRRQR